jgi:hypothetical protein
LNWNMKRSSANFSAGIQIKSNSFEAVCSLINRNGFVLKLNKRQRIPKWQSKMDNPEKLANWVHKTKKKKTKYKHNTICVGHNYTQANTNSVNKT